MDLFTLGLSIPSDKINFRGNANFSQTFYISHTAVSALACPNIIDAKYITFMLFDFSLTNSVLVNPCVSLPMHLQSHQNEK